jgi:hypothetical protein
MATYHREVEPVVAAVLGEPGATPLSDQGAMQGMDNAVLVKTRFDLLGADMPGLARFLGAMPLLAARSLRAGFTRCIDHPGLANARSFDAMAVRAQQFNADVPELSETTAAGEPMLMRCPRFQSRLSITMEEYGMVVPSDSKLPEPYSLTKTFTLGNYRDMGAAPLYGDWTAGTELQWRGNFCPRTTDEGLLTLKDLTLTTDPPTSTDPALPLKIGVTAQFDPSPRGTTLACSASVDHGMELPYNHVDRLRACLPSRIAGTNTFRFEVTTTENPRQAVYVYTTTCYQHDPPRGGPPAVMSLRRLKFSLRHIPDNSGRITDGAPAEITDDKNA